MGKLLHLPGKQPTIPDGYVIASEIIAAAGITWRQMDYWSRVGVLESDVAVPGSGYMRLYPASEIPVAAHIKALLDAGLTLRASADAARALARGQPARLGPYTLTTNPTGDSST